MTMGRTRRAGRRAGAALAVLLATGPIMTRAQEYVSGSDDQFPRIRYPDTRMTVNDRCPVRRNKLNLKIAPIYVNGEPVGFC